MSTLTEQVVPRQAGPLRTIEDTMAYLATKFWPVMLMFAIGNTFTGFYMEWAEAQNSNGPWTWFDGFWWGWVTGTTTGYGDFFPESTAGRLYAMPYMIFGIIVLATVISWVLDKLKREPNEITHDEWEYLCKMNRLQLQALKVELPPEPADTEHGNIDELFAHRLKRRRQVT